jgi:hypothetical protein
MPKTQAEGLPLVGWPRLLIHRINSCLSILKSGTRHDVVTRDPPNLDMRFGLWNVRSLYRAGYLMTAPRELSRYKLDLVGVQEVR